MGAIVVIQSHRDNGLPAWIGRCMESVRGWTARNGFDYRFVGDAMMDRVPEAWRCATAAYPQIAADLGRLYLIRDALEGGAETALWLDADVLVFAPRRFDPLIDADHAFGREIWIESRDGGFRARRNVHNAVVLMRRANPVLDYYIHTAERILGRITDQDTPARVPPQIIGPKLLGALHNITGFPLIDTVAMLSPPVLGDIAGGDRRSSKGEALACLQAALLARADAANLSASLLDDDARADRAIDRLLTDPDLLGPAGR